MLILRMARKPFCFASKTLFQFRNICPLKYGFQSCERSFDMFQKKLDLQDHGYVPTLSPSEVTTVLSLNETTAENIKRGSILGFDSNQLPANNPMEDRRSQAFIHDSNIGLFGVFDGHAGTACAQAVSERLLSYVAASLIMSDHLDHVSQTGDSTNPLAELLEYISNVNDYKAQELQSHQFMALSKYINDLPKWNDNSRFQNVEQALISGFHRLDCDISNEGLPKDGKMNMETFEVAMSGACANVAYISGLDLHVANTGDSRAVLGQLEEDGTWNAKILSVDQTSESPSEVDRIRSNHAKSEWSFVLKNGRLLGQLLPLRSFGDVRYKWSLKDLKAASTIIGPSRNIIPMNYYTPPYLTAEPIVTYHQLSSKDRFLVIASDGLWEMLSNEQVVQLVGEHMLGEETQDTYYPSHPNMMLGEINNILMKRKAGLSHKSTDNNVATHLIRAALGPEHRKISEMLTLPFQAVRYYRDDITVTVIFFDSDYIKESSNKMLNA